VSPCRPTAPNNIWLAQLASFAPQEKSLITCSRTKGNRNIAVTLRREDGNKTPGTQPGVADKDACLQLAFWTKGYDGH